MVSDLGEKALGGVKKEEVEKEEVRIQDTYETKEEPAERASYLETRKLLSTLLREVIKLDPRPVDSSAALLGAKIWLDAENCAGSKKSTSSVGFLKTSEISIGS